MRIPHKVLLRRGDQSLWLLVVLGWLALCLGCAASGFPSDNICPLEVEPQLLTKRRGSYFPILELVHDVCPSAHESIALWADARPRSSATWVDSQIPKEQYELDDLTLEDDKGKDTSKIRLSRDGPLKLGEFKHKAFSPREKSATGQIGNIMHRVEPGGVEYNYASASKGAKVLAFNKEAKGTSNILGKDMDKYLRNPCSAEGKFVIIELSEETLVSMIEIANFEHYSSNLKDFEVLGSLVYPTENWVKLGHFSAKNIKQFQKFRLEEPKWVRYLRLDFLSHYGSEFYCTLSTVKVYGIDAVEHMLEDLISKQDNISPPEEPFHNADGIHQDSAAEGYFEPLSEDASTRNDDQNNGDDQTRGFQSQGKVAGDSALKILMQKVRSLDLNLSVLERYIDELNSRYGNMLKELDGEMAEKTIMLKAIRSEMRNFLDDQENMVKEISDLVSWKSLVSSKIEALKKENTILRSEIERVTEFQMHFDNKIVIVLLVTFSIGFLSTIKLALGFSVNMFTGEEKYREFCRSQASWILLWLNCATVGLVILL